MTTQIPSNINTIRQGIGVFKEQDGWQHVSHIVPSCCYHNAFCFVPLMPTIGPQMIQAMYVNSQTAMIRNVTIDFIPLCGTTCTGVIYAVNQHRVPCAYGGTATTYFDDLTNSNGSMMTTWLPTTIPLNYQKGDLSTVLSYENQPHYFACAHSDPDTALNTIAKFVLSYDIKTGTVINNPDVIVEPPAIITITIEAGGIKRDDTNCKMPFTGWVLRSTCERIDTAEFITMGGTPNNNDSTVVALEHDTTPVNYAIQEDQGVVVVLGFYHN